MHSLRQSIRSSRTKQIIDWRNPGLAFNLNKTGIRRCLFDLNVRNQLWSRCASVRGVRELRLRDFIDGSVGFVGLYFAKLALPTLCIHWYKFACLSFLFRHLKPVWFRRGHPQHSGGGARWWGVVLIAGLLIIVIIVRRGCNNKSSQGRATSNTAVNLGGGGFNSV